MNSSWQSAHTPARCRILRFSSLRISAGDRSSRYPRGWCGSSTRCTPILNVLGLFSFRIRSRPQQNNDRCTGQYSSRRSLITLIPKGNGHREAAGSVGEIRSRGSSPVSGLVQFLPEGKHAESGWGRAGIKSAARPSTKRGRVTERRSDGLGQPGRWEREIDSRSGHKKTEAYVSGCSQENRCGSARSLGEVEERQTEEIKANSNRCPPNSCQSTPPRAYRQS